MSKLNDRRVAITKRIMETKDARTLDAVAKILEGSGHAAFSADEVAGFEEILKAHQAGDGRSVSWTVLRRKLAKEFPARP